MLVVIRGAGDLANGIALRLWRAHIRVVMTRDTPAHRHPADGLFFPGGAAWPDAGRGRDGPAGGDGGAGPGSAGARDHPGAAGSGRGLHPQLRPDGVVDAILAKKNLGTRITDAPMVIGVGPGFTAGVDCHAVVETMRGHYLGRVIRSGGAIPNTGIPGLIGGFAGERVLRAPADGTFHPLLEIGAQVREGDIAATVEGEPMHCTLDGVLRGILAEGTPVHRGMKAGDIDPAVKRPIAIAPVIRPWRWAAACWRRCWPSLARWSRERRQRAAPRPGKGEIG